MTSDSNTYDAVADRLAEDEQPYPFLYGMAVTILRNLVQNPSDPVHLGMARDLVRAHEAHHPERRAAALRQAMKADDLSDEIAVQDGQALEAR